MFFSYDISWHAINKTTTYYTGNEAVRENGSFFKFFGLEMNAF
jgi:hypothetical protein